MRMRHKKDLDIRLENVKDYLILIDKYDQNPYKVIDDKRLINYQEIFGNDNKVVIDLGCGKGGFSVTYAQQNPNVNVIGVEKLSNVIVEACERAQALTLKNLKFINSAGEYLNRYIPNHSVSMVYLNFPCPFFKKTYKNRRLTNVKYLVMYEQMLVNNGIISHKTDNKEFFDYSIEQLQIANWHIDEMTLDLTNSDFDNIITEYESKFISDNRKIYYLKAHKE